jgi:hypothetical protein
MDTENKSLRRALRIYEVLLRLYPQPYRREYGPMMAQLFRDQCRDACRLGSHDAAGLWFRTLADVFRSAFREQFTEQTKRMKNMPPRKLSLILFVMAVGASLFSCYLTPTAPGLALGLAYFSALVLMVRAAVEWLRPSDELIRSLIWGGAGAAIFAFICPQWARLHLPVIPALILIPVLLTGFPPLIKAGLRVATGRS